MDRIKFFPFYQYVAAQKEGQFTFRHRSMTAKTSQPTIFGNGKKFKDHARKNFGLREACVRLACSAGRKIFMNDQCQIYHERWHSRGGKVLLTAGIPQQWSAFFALYRMHSCQTIICSYCN